MAVVPIMNRPYGMTRALSSPPASAARRTFPRVNPSTVSSDISSIRTSYFLANVQQHPPSSEEAAPLPPPEEEEDGGDDGDVRTKPTGSARRPPSAVPGLTTRR